MNWIYSPKDNKCLIDLCLFFECECKELGNCKECKLLYMYNENERNNCKQNHSCSSNSKEDCKDSTICPLELNF